MAVRGKPATPLMSPLAPRDEAFTKAQNILDTTADDDFESPNIAAHSPAAEELTMQEAAEAEPEESNEDQAEQLEMEGSTPETPKVIRDGKMLCEFVRPHFERAESGERFVGFEFAITLGVDHEEDGHLPSEVLEEWLHMRKGNVKRTEVASVEPQTIAIGLVPGDPDNDLHLIAAMISHPVLAFVTEKGKGKTKSVVRFSFRAMVDQVEPIARFAVDHHGDPVWLSIQRTQGSLLG